MTSEVLKLTRVKKYEKQVWTEKGWNWCMNFQRWLEKGTGKVGRKVEIAPCNKNTGESIRQHIFYFTRKDFEAFVDTLNLLRMELEENKEWET